MYSAAPPPYIAMFTVKERTPKNELLVKAHSLSKNWLVRLLSFVLSRIVFRSLKTESRYWMFSNFAFQNSQPIKQTAWRCRWDYRSRILHLQYKRIINTLFL